MLFSYVTEHSTLLDVLVVAQPSFCGYYTKEGPLSTFREIKEWRYTGARHRLKCIRIPMLAIAFEELPKIMRSGL
jgi:hypothetical protein